MKKVRLGFNLERGKFTSYPFTCLKGYMSNDKLFNDLLYNTISHSPRIGYRDYERPKYI